MKRVVFFALLLMSISCLLHSCSKDVDVENEEHVVKFKLYSNTLGVPIHINDGNLLIVKDYWETTFVTKSYSTQFVATCDDEAVLITGEIYVDGKLQLKREGNGYLNMTVRIKGSGY